MRRRLHLPGLVLTLAVTFAGPSTAQPSAEFQAWLEGVRAEAISRGVHPQTVELVLADINGRSDRVIELDRRQPEFNETFWRYLDSRVTAARIERGRMMLLAYGPLLAAVHRQYGVPPEYLVAFWGLETNFGDNTGGFPAAGALATLAFDGRRGPFFREQLLALLQLVDRGDAAPDARASWAGAMGQPQFMPTTYRDYAVDFDGDGRRDLWQSQADVFASAANYLARLGWRRDQPWGQEVTVPPDFDFALSGLDVRKPVREWQRLGVRDALGGRLPAATTEASLLLPAGAWGGPAFLVYDNFRIIMNWNRSTLYAISVGHLADRLAGGGPFLAVRPEREETLTRSEVIEMQEALTRLGYDTGGIDGLVGSRTQEAIKGFQQSLRLPADGYPTPILLEHLRGAHVN